MTYWIEILNWMLNLPIKFWMWSKWMKNLNMKITRSRIKVQYNSHNCFIFGIRIVHKTLGKRSLFQHDHKDEHCSKTLITCIHGFLLFLIPAMADQIYKSPITGRHDCRSGLFINTYFEMQNPSQGTLISPHSMTNRVSR